MSVRKPIPTVVPTITITLYWSTMETGDDEFNALHANHTWDLVDLPKGKKIVGCKWIFAVKLKADGFSRQI